MSNALIKSAITIGLLILLMAVPVYGASLNKSIKIGAGSESDGATTVNGSISVGEGAVVSGTLRTVNGKIRVDSKSTVADAETVNGSLGIADNVNADNLSTVNGSVSVGENCRIGGEIGAVNGRIKIEKGSKVAEDVGNVNGDIALQGSEIGGNLKTVNGNVALSDAAIINGNLIFKKANTWGSDHRESRMPEVVIGPGSVVKGTIQLERKVKLYISESAKVGGVEGVMSMADSVRFSGDKP